jgi:hypothetical protein
MLFSGFLSLLPAEELLLSDTRERRDEGIVKDDVIMCAGGFSSRQFVDITVAPLLLI